MVFESMLAVKFQAKDVEDGKSVKGNPSEDQVTINGEGSQS